MGLSDLFLGKKSKTINPDPIANEIRATQSQGLKDLNNALSTDASQIIGQQADIQRRSLLTSAQDARRNAQRLIAQSGLGKSSLGLASQRSIDQSTGKDIAALNASIPGLIRNQSLQDAQTRIQAGGINQNGINFNKIQGQRSGGILGIASALAPVAGTAIGAAYGGPAGAAMGAQTGQGLSSVFNSQQNPNRINYGSYA